MLPNVNLGVGEMWLIHFSKITLHGVEDVNLRIWLCLTSVFPGETFDSRNSSLMEVFSFMQCIKTQKQPNQINYDATNE